MGSQVKRVLIVDNDLAFVFWLGRALLSAGYDALPARGAPEAIALVSELGVGIDLLIVTASTAGVDTLVEHFCRPHTGATAIALNEGNDITPAVARSVDTWWPKPDNLDAPAALEWLDAIENLFQYRRRTGTGRDALVISPN